MGKRDEDRMGRGTGFPDPDKDRTAHEAARGVGRAAPLSALHELTDDELEATIEEFASGTDRAAGILGAALVQNTLVGAIVTCLTDKSDKEKLFGEKGPFYTFNAQILAGRAFGLFNANVERLLHDIRRIRNKFAHSVVSVDFADKQIATWCDRLKPFENKNAEDRGQISDARRYYEDACYHLTECLLRKITEKFRREAEEAKAKAKVAAMKAKDAATADKNHLGNLSGLSDLLALVPNSFRNSD